jgi:hypothetical protein
MANAVPALSSIKILKPCLFAFFLTTEEIKVLQITIVNLRRGFMKCIYTTIPKRYGWSGKITAGRTPEANVVN